MSRLKGFAARLRSFLRPGSADRRMEEEFAFHVEMETARVERYRQEMRDGRRANWFHDFRDDLRHGARSLVRQKGLTSIAIVSLAIGIGANAAIFSIVNAILLRPRAVSHPEQLVELYSGDQRQPYQTTSWPSYVDLRQRNTVFSGLAAYGVGWQFRLGAPDEVRLVWGEPVSGNYFDVLGVRAHPGRTFLPEEDAVPGRNPVVVIGHGLWQRQLGGDSAVVGRTITLNGQPLTVIGIAPPEYNGMMSGWASEIWVPAMMMPLLDPSRESLVTSRGSKWITMIGRLRNGVTLQRARSEVDVLVAGLRAEHPGEWLDEEGGSVREYFISVLPERETRIHPGMQAPAHALTALLFVVVNLVLLIACMNLAGLLFARAVARRGEIAVRLALGAGRSRIVRQLLAESVLLSVVAGAAGLLLAIWALGALIASMPPLPEGIRLSLDVRLDWRVVAYTLAFSTLTGVLFGLAPAVQSSRSGLSAVLKDDALAFAGSSRPSRSRRLLIIGQVAMSLLLLIGAGLMARSLRNIRPTSLGFATENVLVAPLSLDERTYDRRAAHGFYEQLSDDVARFPEVEGVTLVEGVPGGFLGRSRSSTEIEGYTPQPGESMEIDASVVGPGYFSTMKVPVVRGRDFAARDRDGAPCVTIINVAFATRYLGGPASALGRHLTRHNEENPAQPRMCEIIGIVQDRAWQSLQQEPRPFWAVPLLQSDRRRMTLLVHTAGDPKRVQAVVRRAVQARDPGMPVADIQTLGEHFSAALYPFRLFGLVLGAGGLMALLLATIGIYGTVSYSVAQRRREVGIRMALGAVRSDILRVVVGQGMVVVSYGLALGLLLGLLLTRVLGSLPVETPLLNGVSAIDTATFAGVTLLLSAVALVACFIPAMRAARVDPGVTLRGL